MKVLLLVMVVIASHVSATNYYLSDKGNDLQAGTTALSPWRSLKKLSEVVRLLQPGDSILFQRGSTFTGELKLSVLGKLGKEIFFGPYGSGARPIISGSMEVKNWTLLHDNIWVADCGSCTNEPGNLFIDGQYQPLGRYPNEGYMAFSCGEECKSTLTDNHHVFSDGYWDGAEVVVKSSRWTLDNLPVVNYSNHVFYFSVAASYALPSGYGYFIQKHLATLDSAGEWFFDKSSKKIFLYCKNSDNPSNHIVEVSVTDVGLELSKSAFVAIDNIVFKFQRQLGVIIKYSDNVAIRNCDIEYSGSNGMEISACQNPNVEHCHIENSNNNGVEWNDNTNGSFVRNSIHRTGVRPGRGKSGNGTYIGLNISANIHKIGNNLFQFNSVDSTGYLGIDFRTGGTSIKNNFVSNFCMIKDDGAGIYTWGNSYGENKIDGNIVLHGIGNGNGTNDPDQCWASGIYIDDRSADIGINNNTVAYCGTTGIYIHNAKRLSINGNTLFGNGSRLINKENAQLCIKRDALVPTVEGESLDLRIAENRFVTFHEGNHCVYLQGEKEQEMKGLEFDQNLYFAPNPRLVVAKLFGHQEMCSAKEELTLAEWLHEGCDKNSQFEMIDGRDSSVGSNLVGNSRMTNSTEGWMIWPAQASIEHDKKTGVNAPSLKVLPPPGKKEGLLFYPGISLNSNKWYRLSFSAKAIAKCSVEFVPLMASSPWEALDVYTCFSLDSDYKLFTYFFRPNKGNKNARLNFKSNTSFWLDNVTLSEVGFEMGTSEDPMQLVYNVDEKPKTFSLTKEFTGIGDQHVEQFVLQGYASRILRRNH